MVEPLITYDTAVLAKDLGFNERVKYCYYSLEDGHRLNGVLETRSSFEEGFLNNQEDTSKVSAPTQTLLSKWLMEKHFLYVHCFSNALGWYVKHDNTPELASWFNDRRWDSTNTFKTYDEALEDGLYNALKLLIDE